MNINLHNKAKKNLLLYQKKNKKMYLSLVGAIDELQEKELDSSNIKALSGLDNGYRKRVGRHRILFTLQFINNTATIWIIDIEKDTEKDYKKWISYIQSQL